MLHVCQQGVDKNVYMCVSKEWTRMFTCVLARSGYEYLPVCQQGVDMNIYLCVSEECSSRQARKCGGVTDLHVGWVGHI